MNPSQPMSLSNTLLTVLPLLLGAAVFTFILVSKFGNKNWPGIPSLICRSLLWLARWLANLAEGYDEFLVRWRMKRRDNPICPKNEEEPVPSLDPVSDWHQVLSEVNYKEGDYLARWSCNLCTVRGEVKVVRSSNLSDAEFLASALEAAQVAHIRVRTTETTRCYVNHGSQGVVVEELVLDIGQVFRA
jgi:hypothetical protein